MTDLGAVSWLRSHKPAALVLGLDDNLVYWIMRGEEVATIETSGSDV
jgi:hypothetical protein